MLTGLIETKFWKTKLLFLPPMVVGAYRRPTNIKIQLGPTYDLPAYFQSLRFFVIVDNVHYLLGGIVMFFLDGNESMVEDRGMFYFTKLMWC